MSARRLRNDIKSKRLTTEQLEQESKAMEKRLQELKAAMQKEREERENKEGTYWNAGQKGSLFFYKPEIKDNITMSKVTKVKLLKDEEIVVNKRPAIPGTLSHLASQDAKKVSANKTHSQQKPLVPSKDTTISARAKAISCGQCEERSAAVHCQECSEDFCARCFAAFHLKGALKKHRSMPVSGFTPRETAAASLRQFLTREDSTDENPSYAPRKMQATPTGDSYFTPEKQSNAATGISTSTTPIPPSVRPYKASATRATEPMDSATNTNSSTIFSPGALSANSSNSGRRPLEIVFHSSLSYAEQLLLKQHRRQEASQKLPNFGNSNTEASPSYERIQSIARGVAHEDLHGDHVTPLPPSLKTPRPMDIQPVYEKPQEVSKQKNGEKEATFSTEDSQQHRPLTESMRIDTTSVSKSSAKTETPRGRKSARKSARGPTPAATPREKLQGGHLAQLPSEGLKRMLVQPTQLVHLLPGERDEGGPLSSAKGNIHDEDAWLTFGVTKKQGGNDMSTAASRPNSSRATNTPRKSGPTSARKEPRVSYQLYAITPRSWKPQDAMPGPDQGDIHLEAPNLPQTTDDALDPEYAEELNKINELSQNPPSRVGSARAPSSIAGGRGARLNTTNSSSFISKSHASGHRGEVEQDDLMPSGEYDDEIESARRLEFDIREASILGTTHMQETTNFTDSLELDGAGLKSFRKDDFDADSVECDDADLDVLLSARFQDSLDVEQLPNK